MAQFTYKFVGDTNKILRGKLVRPGDTIDTDEEIINGEFEPTNAAAKSAQKATEAADVARGELHAKEREAAAQGLTLEEAFPELAAAAESPAPPVSAGKSTKSAASPAAPPEA